MAAQLFVKAGHYGGWDPRFSSSEWGLAITEQCAWQPGGSYGTILS